MFARNIVQMVILFSSRYLSLRNVSFFSLLFEQMVSQFQLISNLQKLYQEIQQEQLPIELGGGLVYCHEKWIKFRTVGNFSFVSHFDCWLLKFRRKALLP